jgi:hypothetical protein
MQIAAGSLSLQAHAQRTEVLEQRDSLRVWVDGNRGGERPAARPASTVSISPQAASLQPQRRCACETEDSPQSDLEYDLLRLIVERLTGRVIRVFRPEDVEAVAEGVGAGEGTKAAAAADAAAGREGWGLVYDHYAARRESEQMAFRAEGRVVTADGREIAISVELAMSRELVQEERLTIRAGDALKDPLVVNFAGTAAELTQRDFRFDLDADGRQDQIAFVRPGSGFLALDRNGNRAVDDGSELFGALTGDGFAELAAHDADGNGWIDEGDAVYAGLRIWTRDPDGTDRLVGLGEQGIGAIYLGNVASPFQLKTADGALLGQVANTGVFLREDGSAGTVQKIDLAV